MGIPTLVIAGTSSGVGKTSLTLGMVRSLSRRGLRVQTFKVGPDFLDPTYLTRAAGRTCYNLDGWMCGHGYVEQLFARACQDADIAVVEGVMGMFDGSDPADNTGSTAEMAAWLGAGVILVINSHGLARSVAPLVKGFVEFDDSLNVTGVIANHAGSARHYSWMQSALAAENLPPLLGAMPRNALPTLPSRHLGLVSADEETLPMSVIDQLADACAEHIDLDAIMDAAMPAGAAVSVHPSPGIDSRQVRLGVARDAAFHFAYPDNLEALANAGAELLFFSTLDDDTLPDNLDGLYIPGGYPELFAAQLSRNHSMLDSIRKFGESGKVVYGECGGLMYLGRAILDADGTEHAMVGLAPVTTRKLERLRTLGYVEVNLQQDCLWGVEAATLRGHEFHYSEIVCDDLKADGWNCAYKLNRRRKSDTEAEGFSRGNTLISYVHLHWAASPSATAQFLDRCREAVRT